MSIDRLTLAERVLLLTELDESIVDSVQRPFVTMLPAFDRHERQTAESTIGTLVELGCIEFCCVGPEAELLHDSIDHTIEALGMFHVATSWHVDHSEACEYFLFAAGGQAPNLLAMIASHSELVATLRNNVATAV